MLGTSEASRNIFKATDLRGGFLWLVLGAYATSAFLHIEGNETRAIAWEEI